MAGYLKPMEGAKPMMLLLADALSPRGVWCGPYVQSATAGWVQHLIPGSNNYRYLPYYDQWEPHARKLLDKRPWVPEDEL